MAARMDKTLPCTSSRPESKPHNPDFGTPCGSPAHPLSQTASQILPAAAKREAPMCFLHFLQPSPHLSLLKSDSGSTWDVLLAPKVQESETQNAFSAAPSPFWCKLLLRPDLTSPPFLYSASMINSVARSYSGPHPTLPPSKPPILSPNSSWRTSVPCCLLKELHHLF